MTVADNSPRNAYSATSLQTAFSYTFEILAQTDIKVYQNGTLLTLTTHYTVSGVGDQNGGTVTLVTGAPEDDEIVLTRDMALARTTDYQSGGALSPDTLDLDLDRILLGLQQIERDVSRSLRLAVADVFSNPDTEFVLPDSQTRAGKYLTFDAGGKPTASAGSGVDSALRTDLAASGGSALVGFLPAGSGAAARTVQAKLRERVTPEDFGAVGSGAADDSAALIAANTALTVDGGELRFLAGKTYKVSTNVTFDSDVTLWFEDGARLSIDVGITVTAPGPVLSFGGLPYTGSGTFTADYAFVHLSPGGSLGVGTHDANPHAGDDGTTTRCITVRAATSPLFVGVTRRTPGAGETIVSFEGYTDQQAAPHDELMAVRGIMEGATADQRGGAIGFLTKDNAGTTFRERVRIHDHGDVLFGTTADGAVSTANRSGLTTGATGYRVVTIAGATEGGAIELATNKADASGLDAGRFMWISNNNSVSEKRIAMIQGATNGAAANDRGGDLIFYTKLNGGALTERLRINEAGVVTLGNITISDTFKMSGAKFIRNTNDVLSLQSDTTHVDLYAANTLVCRFPATGTCILPNAGTTARSSLRLPHGSAPTSPVDGDMWTTTAGLYVQINGSTVGPLS